MASGLIALPLAFLMGFNLRLSGRRLAAIAGIWFASWFVYLYQYQTPAFSGEPLKSIRGDPAGVLEYALTFMGGPLEFLTGSHTWGLALGSVTFISASVILVLLITRKIATPSATVAAIYLPYLVVLSLITASGRLVFGLEQALASRYATPVLVGYASLTALVAPLALSQRRAATLVCSAAILAVSAVSVWPRNIIPFNFTTSNGKSFSSPAEFRWTLEEAALALALQVPDGDVVRPVWPHDVRVPLTLSSMAISEGLTYLGSTSYQEGLHAAEVRVRGNRDDVQCLGWVDQHVVIPGSNWTRLRGWVYPAGITSPGAFVTLYGASKEPIGVARLGGPRPDIAASVEGAPSTVGFIGYVKVGSSRESIRVEGQDFMCVNPLSGT